MKIRDLENKRKEREQKKKKVRRQRYKKLSIAVIAVVVFVLILKGLASMDIFTVKNISVSGISRLTEEEILELAKIPLKKSIFSINSRSIEERVAFSPWIKSARLIKSLPNSIKIQIEEEQPILAVKNSDGYWLVSGEAIAIERLKEQPQNLALFMPDKNFVIELGSEIKDRKILSLIKIYKSMSEELKKRIVSASILEGDLYFTDRDKIQIMYGDASSAKEKNILVSQLLEDVSRKKINVYYIDVRVPSKPAIKKIPTPVEIRNDL